MRLADHNMLPYIAVPRLFANDNKSGGDADARLEVYAASCIQSVYQLENCKAGAHGLFGIMLTSFRVAEIDAHAVPDVLGDQSGKSGHYFIDPFVKFGDQVLSIFGGELP